MRRHAIVLAALALAVVHSTASAQDKDKKGTTKPTTAPKDSGKLGTEGTVVRPADEPSTMQAIRAAHGPGPQTTALPDLVVAEIKQDWVDYNTRYRVQVTVKNQGAGPLARQTAVWAGALETLTSIPDPLAWFQSHAAEHLVIGPLAPGASMTFHLPEKHLATTTVDVLVLLNPDKTPPETSLQNNLAQKILGPH